MTAKKKAAKKVARKPGTAFHPAQLDQPPPRLGRPLAGSRASIARAHSSPVAKGKP